jgi:hypothetical protein
MQSKEHDPEKMNTLLIQDKIDNSVQFNKSTKDLEKLSHKLCLIFTTLKSIANNIEEESLEECLEKASDLVMAQLNELVKHDQQIQRKLIVTSRFVQQNEDDKLQLTKQSENDKMELAEQKEQIQELYNQLNGEFSLMLTYFRPR